MTLITGYILNSGEVASNSWYGDEVFSDMDEACSRVSLLTARSNVKAAAVFPAHHWNFGVPTCRPRYIVDKSDYSSAPIRQCSQLINAVSSTAM